MSRRVGLLGLCIARSRLVPLSFHRFLALVFSKSRNAFYKMEIFLYS